MNFINDSDVDVVDIVEDSVDIQDYTLDTLEFPFSIQNDHAIPMVDTIIPQEESYSTAS